ncbi:MAG: hypothetical protein FJW27_12440 [Acidimicrobiia bacterium]|nr:hypothetical protein [Acidimicrobiia bacterium]
MNAVVAWIQATAVSRTIVEQPWIWPAAETAHFLGLALLLGIIGLLDLRLMGFLPRIPIGALHELVPFALGAFGLNVVSGATFLVGHPEQYAHNIAWWLKAASLALAGANALVFERLFARRTLGMREGEPMPAAVRWIGAISMAAWLSVLYWGRMLPFIGDAF